MGVRLADADGSRAAGKKMPGHPPWRKKGIARDGDSHPVDRPRKQPVKSAYSAPVFKYKTQVRACLQAIVRRKRHLRSPSNTKCDHLNEKERRITRVDGYWRALNEMRTKSRFALLIWMVRAWRLAASDKRSGARRPCRLRKTHDGRQILLRCCA